MKTTIQWYKPRSWGWLVEDDELHVYPETPKEPIPAVKQGIEWDNPTDESQLFIQLLYKLLLLKDSQYGYYKNGVFTTLGTTYPTAKDFEDFGMDDYNVITNELIQNDLLQANKIQLLNWFENEESVELGVNGVLNSKFTSIIEAKSSEQVGKIVATDNNQGAKYLVSTDKENWQRWNGTQWETVSWQNKDEINTLGMSKNTLKDITEAQWQALGDTFYLGLYLHNHNATIETVDFQELVPDKTPEISSASLYILNTQAEIDITMTGNKLLGKITDGDKGKVQYRIVLNDEALYPEDGAFTPLLPEPQHINMRIPSNKINIGEQNTIRIEFQDAWGSIDTWARTFIGELNGLLFFDEMDELYSDEQGKVLKYLDFGDIVTGQISQSSKIRLQNTLGHEVTNVTVTVDWGKDENDEPKTAPAGTFLEFSHSDSPFVPLEKIDLGEKILDHEESYEFYVRLRTTLGITPSVSGQLKLCVRAEDTKEAFKN